MIDMYANTQEQQGCKWSQKKKKEIHDKTMKFENYATLTSVSYCLSLLIAGCIIFLLS